ncbi:hypothetical protein QAD02_020155 [Eretmocerus hayati]|uniref:Uncharacterized protein n=1 Tax=Eretmocerus hayati TaxID=131215 RepID=A0ACC2PMP5_9HYME|nr:hypothetical protein QAD02_020155 [Eretmocerus hayati]
MSKSCSYSIIWLALLVICLIAKSSGNAIRSSDSQQIDNLGRPIFNYHRNGFKIDVRVVPVVNVTKSIDDKFPVFPFKEVGHCIIEFSTTCIQKRVARFLDRVVHLPEITLFGQNVKLVKMKEIPVENMSERRMISTPSELIDKNIDDFFDSFALRISLPRWKGKENQIDVMMEDTDVSEGMIGIAAMKGMMFSGMSLMITKMMLLHKLMTLKGGMFGGGGNSGVDEPLEMRPLSEEKWNEETTWKYATDAAIAQHVRDMDNGVRRRREQPVKPNELQPVYARGWMNYQTSTDKGNKFNSNFEERK